MQSRASSRGQKLRCYERGLTIANPNRPADLSDQALLSEVKALAGLEREATVRLIASLAELDARRLYLGEGCSSLFTYCTQVLSLSEHSAYGRIEAARATRRFPLILDLLAGGSVTLTTIGLLAAIQGKREVECIVAAIRPRPAVPSSIRKLPQPVPKPTPAAAWPSTVGVGSSECAGRDTLVPAPRLAAPPSRPAVVAPLAPECYRIQLTVGRETHDKLRQVQDLLRHTVPNGDPAAIFDRALTLLLEDLQRTKHAATTRPRVAQPTASGSRHIPAAVKRAVWARDGGRCAFVGSSGRCTERGFLEYHHVVPFAVGGATTTENLPVRCRAHNGYEADTWFGSPGAPIVRETGPVFLRRTPDDGDECQELEAGASRTATPLITSRRLVALNSVRTENMRIAFSQGSRTPSWR